ncbi:peptidoglycan binding domain-containing protein [Streptomyces sp. PT12]|uniref:peptidoglycan binding domain-containing protein n=1 Tax=Streptomyces sp. PT12 TaxID=1510197 RepID=UPI000DE3BA4C|nr:peptidoglycan binding domain-containing protein [Streptomyces sp. PT12]RBM11849.1 hypothetical protein DEH69_21460 [Streptomyces sp. PT12]
MTTRARINIPGSRPIPPIVVRETVERPAVAEAPAPPPLPMRTGGESMAARGGPQGQGAGGSGGPGGPGKKTSSWFEPRKPPTPRATQGPAGAPPEPERERPPGPDTPPGGHPAMTDTPSGGIAADWLRQSTQTPPAGTPLGLPPRPVGPTAGPATGDMPLRSPAPPAADEDPVSTTMDLGGPFPPPPPPEVTSTGPMAAVGGPYDTGASPVVPPPGPRPPAPVDEGREPAPEPKAAKPQKAAKSAKPKGRSKVRLLAVGVVGIAVVAYGAGLYLSPEDVPSGTTVLGIDIGGLSSEEAVDRLDAELQRANNDPLTLLIGDQEFELKPSVAGLAVDTEATVDASSGQDYSPVSVYGSLLGAERARDAEFAVDREKLTVALQDLTGDTGAGPVDGTVIFENGEAIGRNGEPGNAIDLNEAADRVESAFRERAATGRNPAVELTASEQQPLVGEEQVQRALTEFGEPAMSGWIWLVAAEREPLPLSPETLSGLLTMEPSDEGNLQPVIDTEALSTLYGSRFDGLMIDAGAGLVPITPEHVAAAMIPVLRETATTDDGPGRREAVVEGATEG